MGNSRFTPGPLDVRNEPLHNIYWIEDEAGDSVCDFYSRDRSHEGFLNYSSFKDAEANAYLFSAAPEMHTAADTLLRCFGGFENTSTVLSVMLNGISDIRRQAIRQAIHDLQEALHKAEGED